MPASSSFVPVGLILRTTFCSYLVLIQRKLAVPHICFRRFRRIQAVCTLRMWMIIVATTGGSWSLHVCLLQAPANTADCKCNPRPELSTPNIEYGHEITIKNLSWSQPLSPSASQFNKNCSRLLPLSIFAQTLCAPISSCTTLWNQSDPSACFIYQTWTDGMIRSRCPQQPVRSRRAHSRDVPHCRTPGERLVGTWKFLSTVLELW